MKPKEVQEKLSITADRIKLFKREGIFAPTNPPSGNRGTNYTDEDVESLRVLVVLTKMGLTCSDIRKMQEGEWSLEQAVTERKERIEDEISRKRNALILLSELMEDGAQFETFDTMRYWNTIQQREAQGEEFINVEDMYGYRPVSLIRTVRCPYCDEELEVDLEDYQTDQSSDERESGMGPDIVYSFDSEDDIECSSCSRVYRVSGWIREYPAGAYDSEHLDVIAVSDCE